MAIHLPTHTATRYVQPLREGGSLPAVVETEDGGLFVVKFRGAGQGAKALVAELLAGLLAQAAGLPMPDLALVHLLPTFGRSEPDPEIQDLLRASEGTNLGLRYLDGAFNFDPVAARDYITPEFASRLVWFDAYVTNPDRTARNPNLMIWHRSPWLIDHGTALYAHHDWARVDDAQTRTPFPRIIDHVLLADAGGLADADAHMTAALSPTIITDIVHALPDAWLTDPVRGEDDPPDAVRARYATYLTTRISAPRTFVATAMAAREALLREPPGPLSARR